MKTNKAIRIEDMYRDLSSSKAYKITLKLIDNIKLLRYPAVYSYIPGIIESFPAYGVKITNETIKSFKQAVEDFLAEEFGVEPIFKNDKAYKYWKDLSIETYKNPVTNIFE